MERIKLQNGKTITCLTTENEKRKVYYCNTHKEACGVSVTLADGGKNCSVGFGIHGWMVTVRKTDNMNN